MIKTLLNEFDRRLPPDSLFRRLLLNSGWLLSGNVIVTLLGVLQGITTARMLGVRQYGILALISTVVVTVNQVIDSRVWETAIKFVIHFREAEDHAKAKAVVKLCYLIDGVTALLAFVALFFAAGLAARLFVKDPSTTSLIQLYALSVIIAIPSGTASAVLRIGNSFSGLAYQNVGLAVARLLGVLTIATFGWGIKGVLILNLLTAAAGGVALQVLSQRVVRTLGLDGWSQISLGLLRGQYRRILRFTMYSNMVGTSRIVTSRADMLILGGFATPSEVGLYKLARMLSDPLAVLFTPLHNTLYPELSKLVGRQEFRQIGVLERKLSGLITAIIIPVCLLLTFGMVWLIPALFGKQFIGAVFLTQIMVWQIIWTPLIWLPSLLLSLERSRLLAVWNGFDAIGYIGLLLILVPRFGAQGAALSTLIRFILWTLMAGGIVLYLRNVPRLKEEVA